MMKLFEEEMINIHSISAVDKYTTGEKTPHTTEYNSFLTRYELVFYLYGHNTTLVDEVEIEDSPGSIRYMPKGQTRGKYRVTKHSPGACIDIYFDTCSPMPAHALGIKGCEKLKDSFLKLYTVWQSKRPGYYAQSMMIFYDIIHKLKQDEAEYLSSPQKASIQKAYDYLLQNYKAPDFDYEELCHASGLKYAYFSELFKKTYHMSPVKLVTKMRIDYAKELLVTSRYSMTEIAELCGFDNAYYFSTVFKKQTGFSPSKYPTELS